MDRCFKVIGLMSGTSLDGLDIAYVKFWQNKGRWEFECLAIQSVGYPKSWVEKLEGAFELNDLDLKELDAKYGVYLAELVNAFMQKKGIAKSEVDFIASHGHTVFHQPSAGITVQIGSGELLTQHTGLGVVNDFRKQDVALGGQGAPLVPVGDRLLFAQYDACLNLGGFSNISYTRSDTTLAFDVCPVNILLNRYSGMLGAPYDAGGNFARSGSIIPGVLEALNDLPYYVALPPKSLGREWVEAYCIPILDAAAADPRDVLCTLVEHMADQITKVFAQVGVGRVLLSGGGVYNGYLMERIKAITKANCVVPDSQIIEFKEAIIFGFLGVLHVLGMPNCLASVTGAPFDHVGGVWHVLDNRKKTHFDA